MLKLSDDVRFLADVQIKLKAVQAAFQVECRLLDEDVVDELQKQHAAGTITAEQFIAKWLVGWPEGQVLGSDDQPLPFSAANLARLLKKPGMKPAVVAAFYAGYREATEGNSSPLPAGS